MSAPIHKMMWCMRGCSFPPNLPYLCCRLNFAASAKVANHYAGYITTKSRDLSKWFRYLDSVKWPPQDLPTYEEIQGVLIITFHRVPKMSYCQAGRVSTLQRASYHSCMLERSTHRPQSPSCSLLITRGRIHIPLLPSRPYLLRRTLTTHRKLPTRILLRANIKRDLRLRTQPSTAFIRRRRARSGARPRTR